jgi:hypothetical protein
MCLFTNIFDLGWGQSCRHSQAGLIKLAHRGLVNGTDLFANAAAEAWIAAKASLLNFFFCRHGKISTKSPLTSN